MAPCPQKGSQSFTCIPLGLGSPNPAPSRTPLLGQEGHSPKRPGEDGSTQKGAPRFCVCLSRISSISLSLFSPGASLLPIRPFLAPLPPTSWALCLHPSEALVLPEPLPHPSPLRGPRCTHHCHSPARACARGNGFRRGTVTRGGETGSPCLMEGGQLGPGHANN